MNWHIPDIARAVTKLARTQRRLAVAVEDLTAQQAELTAVQREQVRQQKATNLIVRAQTTTDPIAKARHMEEASQLLDSERRAARHHAEVPRTSPIDT